jgi:hypothetical protein
MPQPKPTKKRDKIDVEPGADKRLASILKRALNTPPAHVPSKRQKRKQEHK